MLDYNKTQKNIIFTGFKVKVSFLVILLYCFGLIVILMLSVCIFKCFEVQDLEIILLLENIIKKDLTFMCYLIEKGSKRKDYSWKNIK